MSQTTIEDRCRGVLIGLAAGDRIGGPIRMALLLGSLQAAAQAQMNSVEGAASRIAGQGDTLFGGAAIRQTGRRPQVNGLAVHIPN